MSDIITPSVSSAAPTEFGAGTNYPAGQYVIAYQHGALQYGIGSPWYVNNSGIPPTLGYHVTDGHGNDVMFPANSLGYSSQALCEAASAGTSLVYAHVGGQIGMYLDDRGYADNTAGTPAPTFSLALAAVVPVPTLAATPALPGNVPSIILNGF